MPAFIALGFLLAFPVTGMVKLSSWSDLKYSALQSQICITICGRMALYCQA